MKWLNQQLVKYSDSLSKVVKSDRYSDGLYIALFYLPSVIDEDRVPSMMIDVNYLPDAYSPYKLDVLQIEDYDWVINQSIHHREAYAVGKELGFNESGLHYFGGFVLYPEDAARYWPLIEKALEDAIAHNFKEVYVWAGTQVRRDNKILGYDEYAILHNLEMTGNPGIVTPVITSPDYVSVGENFTIEIQTNQWISGNFKVYEYNNDTKAFFYSAPIAPYTKVTISGGTVTEEIASTSEAWSTAGSDYKKTATDLANYNSQKTDLADGTYYFKMNCLQEQDPITVTSDIYVTYEYNPDNTIAKLDGSRTYNIKLGDYGFLALNRGRNNRPAVIPAAKIADHPEYLTSEEFVEISHDPNKQEIPGTNSVQGYWKDDPYNTRSEVAYQFHFLFKYYGLDPYNITISSAYNTDKYYIEKYGNNSIVKKWYKGSSLFAQNTATAFISSDDNKEYTQTSYSDPATEVTFTTKYGFYKGLSTVWNSFALLYACDKDGHINENNLVLMGSRTVKTDKSGNLDYTTDKQYYLAREKTNNNNNWKFTSLSKQDAPVLDKNMYEIKTVNFKVKTPFGNFVTASINLSEYSLGKDIDVEDIPGDLKRKYCSFNNRFYKDPALTQQITSYSELTGGVYDIYVGYTVDMPFQTISADAGADAYKTATWYELTDEGSTEANGKKIMYDGSANFKNNGASGSFEKTTEFAFVGNPYELRVIYRDATETAEANRYVGGSTNLDVSTTAGDDYRWEIPNDYTNGSFRLRKFNGTGHWYWNADHQSEDVTYGTNKSFSVTNGNVQTIKLNISGLTYVNGHYIMVTAGGTDAAQVTSTVPTLSTGTGAVRSDGTATVTVNVAANTSGANKTFTLTIQEYNGTNDATIGTATVVTVTQAGTAYTGNTITYSTENSTRIKWLELPIRNFTYNIVDKAGHIAAKATTSQVIYSPLSVASIPSVIVSPFILDEEVTFYTTYGETGRGSLSSSITQLPIGNSVSSTDIFVKYTTTRLDSKPAKLNENQEFNGLSPDKLLCYRSFYLSPAEQSVSIQKSCHGRQAIEDDLVIR